MTLLAASVFSAFFSNPLPLEMPRAEAYLVTDGETQRLEDRFNVQDLWTSRAVLGRWEDEDGRCFTVSRLDVVPPLFTEATVMRSDYVPKEVAIDKKKDLHLRDQCIWLLSPVEVSAEPEKPRQQIRGIKDTLYYEGTNDAAVVCAFLPEKSDDWYLATWELIDGDDHAAMRSTFEDVFLAGWEDAKAEGLRSEIGHVSKFVAQKKLKVKRAAPPPGERELLRADAKNSVTNYVQWHATDSDEFVVLDDLPSGESFVSVLTNDLKVMRAKYAECVPSPLDGSNVLCVARIFRDRDEYLDAAGDDMKWTAAHWNPNRRELVAYLPEGGAKDLLKTIRHEAFHQYLSYAASMISSSPWFNEGYAQYFEDEESDSWELGEDAQLDFEALAETIPALMQMDYDAFYAGTDRERRLKYRLAWSMAFFLEKGAPDIRFEPFRDFKSDYVKALLKYRDMQKATAAAFGSTERLELFVSEWTKFWKKRSFGKSWT